MAPPNPTVTRFQAAIQHAFSQKIDARNDFTKYEHAFKRDYDTAIGLLVTVKNTETLAAMMTVYLTLYTRYAANADNIHFYRSDQTFSELIQHSTRVPADKRDLFEEWSGLILGTGRSTAGFPTLKTRYDALSPTYKSTILAFFKQERDKRRASRSILDVLAGLYLEQRGHQPRTTADLYSFDPYPDAGFRRQFEAQLQTVSAAWSAAETPSQDGSGNPSDRAFLVAFDRFGDYLRAISPIGRVAPVAQVLQVVKYLQDRLTPTRTPLPHGGTLVSGQDWREFVFEMYAAACIRLLIIANRDLQLQQNRHGFTNDELTYFLHPLQPSKFMTYPYYSDVAARIGGDPDKSDLLFEASKTFLQLILLTRNHPFELVNADERTRIQNQWIEIGKVTNTLKKMDAQQQAQAASDPHTLHTLQTLLTMAQTTIQANPGGPVFAQGTIRVGTDLGQHNIHGAVTVVEIRPDGRSLYVEFASLRPFLFRITNGTADDWYFGARLADLYRSTIGVVVLTNAMLLMIGFAPALIEGGFVGLITEVVIYVTSQKVEEAASQVNPTFGKVLGLLVQIFSPRPKGLAEINDPASERPLTVISVDPPAAPRAWEDITASVEEESRLTSQFNRGTVKGATSETWEALKDKIVELEISVQEVSARAKELAPAPVRLADTGTGHFMMTAEDRATGAGIGGRGTGRGAPEPPAVTRLRNSKEYALLDDYMDMLDQDTLQKAQRDLDGILNRLGKKELSYGQARQKIVNLINAAKETTGVYVADGLVWSNWEVRRIVNIPDRTAQIPILDRVYEVRNPKTGEIGYVFAEVKGGKNTRLGWVTRKVVRPGPEGPTLQRIPGEIQQAAPEWYFQKMVEIYQLGGEANEALAQHLFDAARAGKVESVVIKSGRDLEPSVKFDSKFTQWFRNKKWPFPRGRQHASL